MDHSIMHILLLLFTASVTFAATIDDFSDCGANLNTLESALYQTEGNLFQLNRIFFPPSQLPTRFIRVVYTFVDENNEDIAKDCSVTYIWAVGGVLFLQPPALFTLNTLFFNFPNNDFITLKLQLPLQCIGLINGTDGVCSCMNDSEMLDVLTQQLNIYAKFTNQGNVERSNTFARAVCAGELYDIFYSGKNADFVYIIAGAAVIGPLLLAISILFLIAVITFLNIRKVGKQRKAGIFKNTKRKNLVPLALLGIFFSTYILIMDSLAVNVVRTSAHEYAEELSGRSPFSIVVVSYITLICDVLFCLFLFVILLSIAVVKIFRANRHVKKCCELFRCANGNDMINFVLFPSLLVTPCLCFLSHLGYIILAWITEPSKSTTTLLLYYFLFFYLFLIFRKSYQLVADLLRFKKSVKQTRKASAGNVEDPNDSTPASEDTKPVAKKESVDVLAFFINIPLGVIYLGLAVVFILIVYLRRLASEDLFSFLFNVIQFMIVVISTQFAYKLLTGKKFSVKRIVKKIMKFARDDKDIKFEPPKDLKIDEETGIFIASKVLLPHLKKRLSPIAIKDQSTTIEEQPNIVEDQPSTIEDQPNAIEGQPRTMEDQPNTIVEDQPSSVQEPSTITEQEITVQLSTMQEHQSSTVQEQQQSTSQESQM